MICTFCNKPVDFEEHDYVKFVSADPLKNKFYHMKCFEASTSPRVEKLAETAMVRDRKVPAEFFAL